MYLQMYLYRINDECYVEDFKKEFSDEMGRHDIYWIYLMGKKLPDDYGIVGTGWVYALCPVTQIQSGSRPIIKPKGCPQIDFGNDFASAQTEY